MDSGFVYILATLDTKGAEAAWVRDRLAAMGVAAKLVDTGCIGTPTVVADISRETIFAAAGISLADLQQRADRGVAVAAAAEGAARHFAELHAAGKVAGVLALGGSAGTTIGTAAMRRLPLGMPKLMVSTLASGQVRHFVGDKDILMLNAVVDIAGINRISRVVLDTAARAMAGLVNNPAAPPPASERPLIAATMFGVTTPCVERARQVLEAAGYEVLVFHATGVGGQAMESLIAEGFLAGVLDITTTELADELVGGVLSAGPARLQAAALAGIPQVVSVGALDMVNFYGPASVPPQFASRKFYAHNANVTLMRTTVEENTQLGAMIGRKLAASRGPTVVFFPTQGVSAIDRKGQPFDDPDARESLLVGLKSSLGKIELVVMDRHINDPEFAEAMAARLVALIATAGKVGR